MCVLRICASANSNNSIPIHFCYTTTNFYAKPQRICVYGVRVSCFLGKPIEKMLQGEVAYTSQDLLKKVYRKKPILHPFNNCRHFRALWRGLRKAKKKPWHTKGPYFFQQPPTLVLSSLNFHQFFSLAKCSLLFTAPHFGLFGTFLLFFKGKNVVLSRLIVGYRLPQKLSNGAQGSKGRGKSDPNY